MLGQPERLNTCRVLEQCPHLTLSPPISLVEPCPYSFMSGHLSEHSRVLESSSLTSVVVRNEIGNEDSSLLVITTGAHDVSH